MLMLSEKSVGRVEARAFKIAPTASSQCTLNTLMRGKRGEGEGEVPHVHVMIATLPIPASVGELVGVCRRLNQSHHSRVSPPSLSALGELWWSVWKLPKLALSDQD